MSAEPKAPEKCAVCGVSVYLNDVDDDGLCDDCQGLSVEEVMSRGLDPNELPLVLRQRLVQHRVKQDGFLRRLT